MPSSTTTSSAAIGEAGVDRLSLKVIWAYSVPMIAFPDWPEGDHSVIIEGRPRMQINFDAFWINDGLLAIGIHAVNAPAPIR